MLLVSYLYISWHRPSAKTDESNPGKAQGNGRGRQLCRLARRSRHRRSPRACPLCRHADLDLLLHAGLLYMQRANAQSHPLRVRSGPTRGACFHLTLKTNDCVAHTATLPQLSLVTPAFLVDRCGREWWKCGPRCLSLAPFLAARALRRSGSVPTAPTALTTLKLPWAYVGMACGGLTRGYALYL